MILEIILLLVGLAVLVKGADFLIDHSAHLARRLGVSPLIIGLTVVAFGTSLPEFIVSLFAAINGSPDIAISNVVGSNIANIGLILGISAIVQVLPIQLSTLIYEMPFLLVSALLLLILSNNQNLFQQAGYSLGRIDGIILLVVFGLFLTYILVNAKRQRDGAGQKQFEEKYGDKDKLWKDILFISIGLIGLIGGGKLVVDNAVKIALSAGISEAFVGATIIAIGTSLPELVTSIVAALKKQPDIAVGNVVGSNIFNILMVLGVSSLITPLSVNSSILFFDMVVMMIVSLLLLLFVTTGKRLTRSEGIIMTIAYAGYLAYLIYQI